MKYNFSKIKESKNYIKVGNTEEIVNEIADEEANEIRSRFKKVIEPWLSAALQSEHLSLLIGAGLTTAVCQIAKVSSSSMGASDFGEDFSEKVDKYAKKTAEKMGRGNPNIEDQIRTATALLRGYEIDEKEDEAKKLGNKLDDVLSNFANSILSSETNFFKELIQRNSLAIKASAVLQSFLFTFASRNIAYNLMCNLVEGN
jgi:VIT1/CCC1 family predicted Fe2+/Mn2+ transporter